MDTKNRFAIFDEVEESDGANDHDSESDTPDEKNVRKVEKKKKIKGSQNKKNTNKNPEFIQHWNKVAEYLESLKVHEVRKRLFWLQLKPKKKQGRELLIQYLIPKYHKLCEKIFSEDSKMARQFRNNNFRGMRNQYHFDYLVVVDFEATCEKENPEDFQHEIIQFPAVLIDVHRQKIIDEFNSYCKPKLRPTLSRFCTELTGITQETVTQAPDFTVVLEEFKRWLDSHGLGTKYTFSLVADGFCDMGKFLYTQCKLSGIEYPYFALQWVDIRILFFHFYGVRWYKLAVTMELIGERFTGTLHNGLDDSKNIGTVLLKMLHGGANPIQNEKILLDLTDQENNPPSHKYDLKTVKHINPREFFASQSQPVGFVSNRSRTPEQASNKENWFRSVSRSPPDTYMKTPPPVPKINKLKIAMRRAWGENVDDDYPSLNLGNVVPNSVKPHTSGKL